MPRLIPTSIMPHERRIDLLSDHIEPHPNREFVNTTHANQEEEHDGDMIDLDDFDEWSQSRPLSTPMSTSGRSNQDRETAAAAAISVEDEDDDDAMDFEEHDDFSTTKTSSDHFVRYSQDSDTPSLKSIAIMGDAGGMDSGLNLDSRRQQENPPGLEDNRAHGQDSWDSGNAIVVDSTSNDEQLNVLGGNSGVSSEQLYGSGDSGGSDSTVRARTIICSPVGIGDTLAEERQNDFDQDDEPIIELFEDIEDEPQTTERPPSVVQVRVDFNYDSDDEATTQFIEDIADPAAPSVVMAHPNTNSGIRQASGRSGPAWNQHYNESIEVIAGYLDNGIRPSDARSLNSYGMEEAIPAALPPIKEETSPVPNKSSSACTIFERSTKVTESRQTSEQIRISDRYAQQQSLEERVKDTRTGLWILLPRTLSGKKEIVLTIFLDHTTRLFATSLRITHINVFTSNFPIPHTIWSGLFTPHEASRLFEAQNQKLHASAVARTKTLLEEWRISSGFPRVPEAYQVKERIVSYTYKNSERERGIAQDLLQNRTVKTETWMRRIFDLGKGEIDDGMYDLMVESVLELISEIYECPMGVVDEHLKVKNAGKELRSAVVDELGVLLEGLRLA